MSLALYRLENGAGHPAARQPGAHAGLWYDKFFGYWESIPSPNAVGLPNVKPREPSQNDPGGKAQWVAEMAKGRVGDQALISEVVTRFEALVRGLGGGEPVRVRTVWRFASGLGRSHPVENGFVWHHTLGTPYLPGSSIKGMLRAFATDKWGKKDSRIAQYFGSPTDDEDTQRSASGTVIVLNALPVVPVALEADVMTPHYSDWYQSDGDVAPGDWMSPNPIPFLTVAPGNWFVFGIAPRRPSKDEADCRAVKDLLVEALSTAGAGAKTAVNYGRFEEERSAAGITTTGPAAAGHSQARRSMSSLRVGEHVVVYDEPATVTAIKGDTADVRFDDGGSENVPLSKIKRR